MLNPQLQEAMANQEMLRQRQQMGQNMMQPTGGAGGKTDILGALIGGIMSGRSGKKLAEGRGDIENQIAQMQQAQAAKLAQQAQAQHEAKLKREDYIRTEKHKQAIELKGMNKSIAPVTNVYAGGQGSNITSAKPEAGYYHVTDPNTGIVRAEKIQGASPLEDQQVSQKQNAR
jgi:hypothetical protein